MLITLKLVLYLVGLHVLAVREHNNLLCASCDEDVAALINTREVASMQIAIAVNDLSCLLRAVVIAQHDVRALDTYLPIYDAAVDSLQGQSATSWDIIPGACEGYNRGSLCHAISLIDLKPEGGKSASYLRVESGTATDTYLYMPAHLLMDRTEDEAREAAAPCFLAYPEQEPREAVCINLCLYAIVESLP